MLNPRYLPPRAEARAYQKISKRLYTFCVRHVHLLGKRDSPQEVTFRGVQEGDRIVFTWGPEASFLLTVSSELVERQYQFEVRSQSVVETGRPAGSTRNPESWSLRLLLDLMEQQLQFRDFLAIGDTSVMRSGRTTASGNIS